MPAKEHCKSILTHLLLFYFGSYVAYTMPATLGSEVYKHID